MAYWKDTWRFRDSNEIEYKFAGRYGAKGEKRKPKKKASPEQIAKQNQRNKEIRTRRLIKENFEKGDIWSCCKYPKGMRLDVKEVKDDKKRFFRILRDEYRKRGSTLKWIARLEIGARGGIHFHVLINRITDSDVIIADAWSRAISRHNCRSDGLVDYRSVYDDVKALAEYMCKAPEEGTEEYKQISMFEESDKKALLSLTSSKNLIRPEPEHVYRSHWTMRKIIENGPVPTPGYKIDEESVLIGVNPYTGYSYCKYTEVKIAETSKKTKCGATFHPPRGDDVR